ncbi:hypothetical protein T09_981 [Trichinella sp. T9]|nr:hypothetical protein T09_981 [Trichinella sp. T9]
MFSLSGPQTTSTRERERSCSGVTSVIFRYGVHTKTVLPIHCNEKQNGKCTKCELSPCQQKHGILVLEETDSNQSQDREEEIDKKRELEKNFDRTKPLEEEEEVEKRSTGCYALGYASGKFFVMPPANLKKYLPSGYASGYASGNFFKIFKKIAQGNALSYPSGYALGHPRGCLSLNN